MQIEFIGNDECTRLSISFVFVTNGKNGKFNLKKFLINFLFIKNVVEERVKFS